MKIVKWILDNILFILTLFLLAFIPLFPKLPLIDIKNTWVYVRIEDIVIILVLFVWVALLMLKKVTLKTPLTLPIMIFWVTGAIATIHGVLLIFPTLANVFPNVAFLSFLRRIEYISLFFVAYAGIKDKRFLPYFIAIIVITLFVVFAYGMGQKYYGFPAFLTMNEEFAKGVPIQLSSLSRLPSTFGGHYDLAAYLVLIIPILASLVFGFRNWLVKLLLLAAISCGIVLLFMTVSRVSFFVLLISIFIVLFFQMKKYIIFSLPFVVIFAFLFFTFSTNLLNRFGSSVKEVDVLIEAQTGQVLGHIQLVPSSHFKDKLIKKKFYKGKDILDTTPIKKNDQSVASTSAIFPYYSLPPQVILLVAPNAPTGENLPQGTGYINLTLSPVTKKVGEFFYEKPNPDASGSAEAFVYYGEFLIKKASAYDLSFTTRFQGEWPRAIDAFKKNILFGSGYSSVSLAVDNNYLRILGEIGLLGFAAFFGIFLVIGIYIRQVLPEVDSLVVRSFVFGFVAGVVGLALNAIFIDVFEASKIAYLLWILTGVTLGTLSLYQTKHIDVYKEVKKSVTSTYAIIVYLFITTLVIFSPMINNFFVGDDFTWFRWVADCGQFSTSQGHCPSGLSRIYHYFTQSDGFFYRPGTKVYFYLMYSLFWLNQTVFHVVSILLHFIVIVLLYLLARKVLRDNRFAVLSAFLFLVMSGYSENVFWLSSTGHLFNAMFILLSLLFFIMWDERKKLVYLIVTFASFVLSLLFHELGLVTPLLIILYKFTNRESLDFKSLVRKSYVFIFFPILPYLAVRFLAQSHWFNGDYSYNLLKLPFNIIGNSFGYILLDLLGPTSLPIYQALRNFSKENVFLAVGVSIAVFYLMILGYQLVIRKIEGSDRKIIIFGFLFFLIALIPFLGLGNITSRYSYLSSFGFIIIFVFLIKKLYHYLIGNGRDIAIATLTVVITFFCLLHIIQLQQIHGDWYEAGEKVKRFFVAIDESYSDYWAYTPMKFYFVNVPLKVGEAWVFPVGLSDALWFGFRNPNIHVYQIPSVEVALNMASGFPDEKIFVFDERGRIVEKKKVVVKPLAP